MGCSSEAARKRTQRSINGDKHNYNSNNNNKGKINSHSDCYKNSNKTYNNNNNYCDSHKSSDNNNLVLLSSELICQSNSDNDDETTITKDNNNCRRREVDKTTVKAIQKSQNQGREEEEQEEEDGSAEAEETEKQIQSKCSGISVSVEAETVQVFVEELQRVNESWKFCATCENWCTRVAIDINNNNSNTNNNNNNSKEATNKGNTNNNNKEVNTCANFCHATNGNHNCCHREFAREQLPQARVALQPQPVNAEDQNQSAKQEDELWHARCVGMLSPSTEMAAATSTTTTASEPRSYIDDAIPTATHNRHRQGLQELLQHTRGTLTKRLVGLRGDMSTSEAMQMDARAVGEEEATRRERRKQYQQPQECWKGSIQPLQMAYKRGRQHVEERYEKQQQQQMQRNDAQHAAKCDRRQRALQATCEQQKSALIYCHQKQKDDHQKQHQKHQQQKLQQQQRQPFQQQQTKLSVNNKQQKEIKASQLQQQQQHHSAQEQQQQQQQLEKQQKFLEQKQPLKNLQNQQKQQQQQRHRLRRGIQTMAAAAYGAFSYIGHNYYHLLGNSISFYAASSVILVLCYLTTTTAAAHSPDKAPFDKHPIRGIDWSKFDESSSDKEILDLLLEKKRYDKRLLPPVNDEDFCCGLSSPDMAKVSNSRRPHNRGTLTVNVNVLLLSLASPDESSLKYEVEFLLNQQWNDPRLQYGNKSHYDFLNALHHHDSIWTPDTYFIMHGDFKDPIIPMHFALRIYRNGTITYAMRRHLILSCQGSLHIFPFDDPKCSFSMESISYEEAQIKYVWKNDEDTLRKSPSLTTLNAYLIKNQTTPCDQNSWRGNYSCLRVDLIFTRDRAFYFTTVFIPGIILVTSSFITFWLEWNAVPARSMIGNYSCLEVELTFTRDRAYYFTTVFIPGIILVTSSFITFWLEWNAVPARVMIGVTTMLNFFTTSNGFRSTLPVVSNLTAMNVWDGVCMCFIYASLLEFVCVNYMGRKRPQHNAVYRPGENPVTQRLPAVLSRIGVILASPLGIIEREFHAALSSEKATQGASSSSTTAGTSIPVTPTQHMMHTYHAEITSTRQQQQQQQQQQRLIQTPPIPSQLPFGTAPPGVSTVDAPRIRWEEQHGGIIGVAMQNLRARSIRRRTRSPGSATSGGSSYADTESGRTRRMSAVVEPVYHEPTFAAAATITTTTNETAVSIEQRDTTVTVEMEPTLTADAAAGEAPLEQRSRTISTNTPSLVLSGKQSAADEEAEEKVTNAARTVQAAAAMDITPIEEKELEQAQASEEVTPTVADASGHLPVKPPRRKRSRSNSPTPFYEQLQEGAANGRAETGEKRRDVRAPNEIVACTTCGGSSSPCTHSANNGCATETCFVQVRKKEPPHPIRIAKTIDVIARITFPTAYAIFLIFFFVHYKGFS